MHKPGPSTIARKEGEARPQACRKASSNSFVHEAHIVPQPLGPEDLYATLVYEIKAASDTAVRETRHVAVAYLFADVYNSTGTTFATEGQALQMKHAEQKLLTIFFEEACVKVICTYQQWVQYAISISKDILNTTRMLTTITERMLSKLCIGPIC